MLTAILLLALADGPAAPVLDKEELKKLQGHWVITQLEHGGKKTPAKELLNLAVEVSGSKMTTREAGELKEDTTLTRLDAKATPPALDLKVNSGADVDKVVLAIYQLKDDTLTICFAEPGKERPKELAARTGSGHTLIVFKRVKK
jgi:uncharacterized protein (TIGR03067 family)